MHKGKPHIVFTDRRLFVQVIPSPTPPPPPSTDHLTGDIPTDILIDDTGNRLTNG